MEVGKKWQNPPPSSATPASLGTAGEEEREWEVKGGKEGRPEKPTLDSKGTKTTGDLTQNCDNRKRRRNGVGYGISPNIIVLP